MFSHEFIEDGHISTCVLGASLESVETTFAEYDRNIKQLFEWENDKTSEMYKHTQMQEILENIQKQIITLRLK